MLEDSEILAMHKEEGKAEQAFNLVVRKYGERLYWHLRELVISHEDANDLLQSSLIKVWKNLPSFREESKLYTWLYKIATNEALTFLKKKRVTSILSLSDYSAVLENRLQTDNSIDCDKLQRAIRKEVIKLPDKQRAVFSLRYYQDLSYEEIAQILGSNATALKTAYHHEYKKIKNAIEEQF